MSSIYLAQAWCERERTEGQNRKTRRCADAGETVEVKKRDCMESVCPECTVAMRMEFESGGWGGSKWVWPSFLKEKIKRLNESIDPCGCLWYYSPLLSLFPTLSFIQLFLKCQIFVLFCRRICDFEIMIGKMCRFFLSKCGLSILWGPSNSSVYVHLIVEMTDTLEMTDWKYSMYCFHIFFYKWAGI